MGASKAKSRAASDLHSHIGFWLRFVSNHVSQEFARQLLGSGVTVAEWVVLREMFGREAMSPGELAGVTGLTRGAISKLMDRLLVKKLVTREGRDDDRRFQEIALTPAGRRLVPTLAAIADRNDQRFFAPLSERERETLTVLLQKLVGAHGLKKLPTE